VYATGDGIAAIGHAARYRVDGPLSVPSSFFGRPLVSYVTADPQDLLDAPAAIDIAIVDGGAAEKLAGIAGRLPGSLRVLVVDNGHVPVPVHERVIGTVRVVAALSQPDPTNRT
jgi:hypothetical protein